MISQTMRKKKALSAITTSVVASSIRLKNMPSTPTFLRPKNPRA